MSPTQIFAYFIFVASMFGCAVTWYYIKRYKNLDKDTKFLDIQMKCLFFTAMLAFAALAFQFFSTNKNIAAQIPMPNEIVSPADNDLNLADHLPAGNENDGDFYDIGQYKVGVDIPAGQYLAIGDGYLEVAPDSSGNLKKIVMNDNVMNRRYITVNDGEYLKITNTLKLYPVEKAPPLNLDLSKIPDGQYKVGVDIPAGEYKVKSLNNGYFEVTKDDRGSRSIITNSAMKDPANAYITVTGGQYIKINRAEMQLQ